MDGLKARLSFDAVAYDYDDEYLTIDTDTHIININNVSRLFGVQYDGNSKLIKFRISNKLSDIQKMQDSIVYINWIDSKGVKGQSIAINKTISNDICEFAWKVPFDALKNSRVLHFAMSAVITANGSSVINQKWSTQIASVIIPDGIYIKSYTPSSEEEDRIAQIYNELSKMINKQNEDLQSQVNLLNESLGIYSHMAGIDSKEINLTATQQTDFTLYIPKGCSVTISTDSSPASTFWLSQSGKFDESVSKKLWDNTSFKSITMVAEANYFSARIWKNADNESVVVKIKYNFDESVKNTFINEGFFNTKNHLQELMINFEQGTYEQFNDKVSDDIVRTQVFNDNGIYLITMPDGILANCCFSKNTYPVDINNVWHPFSIISDEKICFAFFKRNGEPLQIGAQELNEIKIWQVNSNYSDYDLTVSAPDSNLSDKNKSDIICTDDNANDILACLFGSVMSIKVLLYSGNYNLYKAWSNSTGNKCSLTLDGNSYGSDQFKDIIVHGNISCEPPASLSGVFINVSKQLHDSLDLQNKSFIIASPYGNTSGETRCGVNFKNFNIIGYKYDKPIQYIDTTECMYTTLENVNIRGWNKRPFTVYDTFDNTPNLECTGIRVGKGSNYGIKNYLKHLNVWFCGKGVACNGEHFIFEDVKTLHDYIGFVFGDTPTIGKFEHPNIMIGCSIEGCYRLMWLSKMGVNEPQEFVANYEKNLLTSTLVIIGTSTETTWAIPYKERVEGGSVSQPTKGILEILRGCYRGRIEMDNGSVEDGSCSNMVKTFY